MVYRITSQMLVNTTQSNLQSSMARLANLQSQAGTQKLITKPSDDPAGTGESMRIRADQRALTQYGTNIDNGLSWLTAADSALSSATSALGQVRDLTVQGSNSGSLSASAREAIATQLDQLKPALLAAANQQFAGRPVFAGNTDSSVAFNPDASYNGVSGSTVQRRIGPSTTVRVDGDGAAAFGVGTNSVFALVDTIAADLRAGNDVSTHLTALDSHLSAILGEQARVGAVYSQLEGSKVLNAQQAGSLEAQRSSIEDVDLSKVILDLKTQEVAYQTALSVTAKALQPTLMSFLS
jgi:flagellar hook-associated protein 3 FlgL